MQMVTNAFVCEGTYNDKAYKNGRLIVANFQKPTDKVPNWVTVAKTTPEIAESLRTVAPIPVTLYYDNFKNVVGYKKDEKGV